MKFLAVTLLLAIALTGCGGSGSNSSGNRSADIKKGVQPVADNEIAVIELENAAAYGTIKIELYSNIAPKMVERFKELAREGYYDGIIFHRVNAMVIQAGNSDTKPGAVPKSATREGDSGKPNVPAEFSDVLYDTGIVGAARLGNSVNSANSQFFITLRRMPDFDQNYTIFGKVIDGMNNARTIAGVPKDGEKPIDPVRIKTIRIEPKQ
jgi:cyclophilin family peptidyl-prolyl cis-trans isomerase